MNDTHFTEADRKLLTQLEMGQKMLAITVEKIEKKLDEDVFVKKVDADKTHSGFEDKFNDIEKRMRWVERIAYSGIVLLAVAEFIIRFFI